MQIVLASIDPNLADAFEEHCGDLDGVSIHRGSILNVECDAIVSPANSFGFMDGGIDALYVDHFGVVVEDNVRRAILQYHGGELLVGAAEIVETGDAAIPYLIAAPTMRVPMALDETTVHPFLAMRAVIQLVQEGRFKDGAREGEAIAGYVERVSLPGLGTGVGRVAPGIAARQIRAAVERHRGVENSLPRSWAEASYDHQLLYTDTPGRLQR